MNCSVRSSHDCVGVGLVGGGGDWSVSSPVDVCKNPSSRSFSYTAERVIGNGSFGVVYQAVSSETRETVAIKKVFQDRRYKNREFQIMKELGIHPNIVTLHHAFYTNGEKPEELFLNVVMEYVPDTIHKLLKSYLKQRQQIPLLLSKLFAYQLSRALAFIHSSGVCHRDIKPQNLLICPHTHVLKLCDFGSAKRLVSSEQNVSYICSRYYRAPELIFGAVNYSHRVDLWSMGCVLAELIQGTPVFQGENGVDQLVQIIKVLGTPTSQQLLGMNPHYSAEFKFPQIKSNQWTQVLKGRETGGAEAVLEALLQYDPNKRQGSAELLNNRWFDELRKEVVLVPPDMKPLTLNLFNFTEAERVYLK